MKTSDFQVVWYIVVCPWFFQTTVGHATFKSLYLFASIEVSCYLGLGLAVDYRVSITRRDI